MSLQPGARLGAYEIVSPLGAGGMGEVYRARDTRLNRTVAIKLLAPDLMNSAVARQRFEREARAIAALSHPHICPLFDIGRQNDADFLVMEYLDGETLAARLERGPLPLEQVLRYGTQIADALARAHHQGIIHRDLKPGNIMLTKAGAKLLDFGLAKAGPTAILGTELTASNSKDHQLTKHGTILGTLPYMAPELLEGKEADVRSDIFAVGAVVYEMVTGQRAFAGTSEAALIAAILQREPESMSRVQVLTPPALERTVKTCLAKDPDDRFQAVHDVLLQFRWALDADSVAAPQESAGVRRLVRHPVAWVISQAAVVVVAVLLAVLWTRRSTVPPRPIRFTVPGSVASVYSEAVGPAISPDGHHLAFEVLDAQRRDLILLRSIDALDARPIEGTESGFDIFWSPDSRSFGFFSGGKLKTVAISGGPPTILCDAVNPSGGSWGRNGIILFATGKDGRIHSIPEGGGRSTPVTKPNAGSEERHRWPSFLPDGRKYLYVAQGPDSTERPSVYLGALDSNDRQAVPDVSSRALYTVQGYLLFVREGMLSAAPFDTNQLRFTDTVKPLSPVRHSRATGSAVFSASENGTLALQSTTPSRLLWFNRNGREEEAVGEPSYHQDLRISPDGKTVALVLSNPLTETNEIWLKGLARATSTRLTFGQQSEMAPVWSPDGLYLAYASGRMGSRDIYRKFLGDSGKDEAVLVSEGDQGPVNWSRDGAFISYDASIAGSGSDVWVFPTSPRRKPFPFVQTPAHDCCGHFSAAGRWLAYQSAESGQNQVYVKPFPGPGAPIQISTAGGRRPRWRADGKELFYIEEEMVMAVDATGTTMGTHAPRMLFETEAPILAWDVAADGSRFLLATFKRGEAFPPMTVVVNWPTALQQR